MIIDELEDIKAIPLSELNRGLKMKLKSIEYWNSQELLTTPIGIKNYAERMGIDDPKVINEYHLTSVLVILCSHVQLKLFHQYYRFIPDGRIFYDTEIGIWKFNSARFAVKYNDPEPHNSFLRKEGVITSIKDIDSMPKDEEDHSLFIEKGCAYYGLRMAKVQYENHWLEHFGNYLPNGNELMTAKKKELNELCKGKLRKKKK
ncbi:MAG: hypothetical protein COA97_02510 [Flavobacteriales bacterium]|nr:MAG: hypothetical protein COA97_02510 [Flavobacteriales bacterium]